MLRKVFKQAEALQPQLAARKLRFMSRARDRVRLPIWNKE